jgi:hypothetical protein
MNAAEMRGRTHTVHVVLLNVFKYYCFGWYVGDCP